MELTRLHQIHVGARFVVYRAQREGAPVVVKTLRPDHRDPKSEARLRQEHALLRGLAVPGVVRPLSLEELDGRPALVLADAGPLDLEQWLRSTRLTVTAFLELATRMVACVAGVHSRSVIHGDLCPANFVLGESVLGESVLGESVLGESGRVTLVDFELGAMVGLVRACDGRGQLEATLPYLAPEQTGRMQRRVDQRADLYALGATFYQMLVGTPPFTSSDPLEVVHAHLAIVPVGPIELRPELPRLVSDLVLKLLAKMPEWRYQTAEVLQADLEEAGRQWRASGSIAPFALARLDRRELPLAAKLCGRERERAELEAALRRAVAGQRELIVVQGLAGAGKTALVEALRPAVEAPGSTSDQQLEPLGRFLAGKCDPLTCSVPFLAFSQAFGALARELLAAPEAALAEWRQRLGDAVFPNARALTEIAPELSALFGEQPPLAPLGPADTANRAVLTLVAFVRALARPEHVLVLFLDDVQWADPASLELLARLGADPDLGHLLVILAWRSEEVGPEHPAARAVSAVRRAGARVSALEVGPLDANAFAALLGEALGADLERCRPLGELLVRKTAGNPLLAQRFLQLLHASDCLTFDLAGQAWTWDLGRIAAQPAPQDVVDLLAAAMARLPPRVKELLAVAACIGSRFDAALLEPILQQNTEELAPALRLATREVWIVPTGETSGDGSIIYRFVHDRLQQAAYALVSEARRAELHLEIGRCLYARMPTGKRVEQIFEVVDQLNRGAALLREDDERLDLLDLNQRAAAKAKATAAYGAAYVYLKQAIALLPADAWTRRYELAFHLHRDAIELAFVTEAQTDAEALSEVALGQARSRLDKASLHTVRMSGYTLRLDVDRAMRAGQEALRLFGLDLLDPEPDAAIARAFTSLEERLASRAVAALADAALATDPDQIALQRVLSELVPMTYQMDPKRHTMVVLWGMNACLDHGHTPLSPSLYVAFAMQLVMRGQFERGHAFGRLAIDLARKLGLAEARTLCSFAYFINHWRAPFRSSIPVARAAVGNGIECCDFQYVAYSQLTVISAQMAAGTNLDSIRAVLEDYLAFCAKICSKTGLDILGSQRLLIERLTGRQGGRAHSVGTSFDEAAILAGAAGHPMTIGMCANLRCWASYLLGDLDDALAMLELAGTHLPFFVSQVEHAQYVFHAALTLAARADGADAQGRAALVARVQPLEARLQTWSESCPENFRHKHELVLAELTRLEGGRPEHLYLQAIDGAAREGLLQDEALAQELCARYCLARGQRHLAAQFFGAAVDAYARWGASAKVVLLQEELARLELPTVRHWETPRTPAAEGSDLDLLTAFKAAETLSSEVRLDALLEKMMLICVETAGAQRASLLVEHEGQLRIECRFDAELHTLELNAHAGRSIRDRVSEAIVRHTLRSGEEVVLGNAAESGAFTRDPYVLARTSKSILSMATDAFTHERLKMLRLLLAQAAISLENARLYASVRANEALLRDFFEGMPVGVYVIDARGKAAFANRRAAEITGKVFDPNLNVEGIAHDHQIYKAGTDELYPTALLPLARALRGEAIMVDDLEIRRPDRTIPVAAWATPIRGEDGAVRYALVAFQDISEQRAMEANRAHLEARLHQAQRLESLGRLAGGLAHDFNNLLMPIVIGSELALEDLPGDSPLHEQLAQVHGAAEQAAQLTRQLLAFGRQQPLEMCDLDLNGELRGFAQMFRRLVRRDIEVELRLDPELGIILGDRSQLQRLFMNLGLNAVDAMPQGGRVTFQTENLAVDPGAALRVSDTGQGMDKDTLALIFEPFFSTKGPGKGTGLGLPTVYGIVTQHGGHIDVHSERGKGTTFDIQFPQRPAPGGGPPRDLGPPAPSS
jgi:PAS domain S-box-containing protein